MREKSEKLAVKIRWLALAVFAMQLVACGSEAGSADNVGKPAAPTGSSNVEVLGEITAKLNGEPRTWYVTREYKYGRWKGGVTRLSGTFSGTLPDKSNSSPDAVPSNVAMLENGRFDVNLIVSD